MDYMILLQAINQAGGISADWILVGITGIAVSMFVWILLSIKGDIKDTLALHAQTIKDHEKWLQNHDIELTEHKSAIRSNREMQQREDKAHDKSIEELKKNTEEIILKLNLLKS